MFDRIISYSIQHKLVIGLFIGGLIAWGLYSLQQLPIDAVPDITNNQVQVITQSPSLAAPEVEQFITYPVEKAMQNLPGVLEVRSISRFGLSVVTIVFEDDQGTFLPRQLVSEKLKEAENEIPEGFGSPEMAPITTGLGEVYQYTLRPKPGYEDKISPMQLRTIQDWIVKRQLSGIPGVIEVNSFGGFLKQFEVAVKPERLRAQGLGIEDVFEALSEANQNSGGAYIERGPNAYYIRSEGMLQNPDELGKIAITSRNGIPVLIRDVAEVRLGHAPRFGAMTTDNIGEVAGAIVMMLKGANSADVIQRVKARLEKVKANLPEGVMLDPYLDRDKLVRRTTATVAKNLIEGGLIVIFVLVILLGNFRASLVVASVIPLAMLFAFGMMRLFGVSANLMSLGAIDFGLIVDGSVIIVESIVHRLNTRFNQTTLSREEMDREVTSASIKIRKSAAFGEIIILMVYLPILALVGIEGKMFKPMAQTVIFAILGALILSLTYVPMMSSLLLSRKIKTGRTIADRIIDFLRKFYSPALKWSLKNRLLVTGIAIGLFVLSLFRFASMGGEFIPTLDEGDLALHQILPPGSSLSQSIETSGKIQQILLDNFPEVEKVVTKIGAAEVPTDPMPVEAGDIMVIMKEKSEWTTAKTREEMFEKMEEKLSLISGVSYEFTQPIQMRFNELISGVRQDIAIKIYGEDLDLLYSKARQAEGIIDGIDGVGDIMVEQTVGLQQLLVTWDYERLARYGLQVEHLNKVLRTAFAGEKTGVMLEGEKHFDVVVRLHPESRKDIDDLQNLYVHVPEGPQIPLREVADIRYVDAPMQISRENAQRRIVIGVNARGRDTESLVEEIQANLKEKLTLPAGYYLSYGGQFENLRAAKDRLMVAVPVALLLIFVLLYLTFHSIRQALLIFSAIPLSAIGGIWALSLRGMPFSISAGIGFIALFGVAVLNGIVLIAYFNELKKEGVTDLMERIKQGTSTRLRPVIMTAAVASLGFLPMALSGSAGAEVQKPLATVVIGGLVTATLLTLLILPVLYSLVDKQKMSLKGGGKALSVLLLLGLAGGSLSAQSVTQVLSEAEAVELVRRAHPRIQAAQSQINAAEKSASGSFNAPPTSLSWTYGQLNTEKGDQQLTLQQKFRYPGYYSALKKQQLAKVNEARAQANLTEAEMIRQVRMVWQEAACLTALGIEYDSLLASGSNLETAAKLRFETGETNRLEYLNAKAFAARIRRESRQIQMELSQALFSLQFLTQLSQDRLVISVPPISEPDSIAEAITFGNANPYLLQQKSALAREESALLTQKRGMIPNFSLGGFYQSIDRIPGFFGLTVGVDLPLFFGYQRKQIQASQLSLKGQQQNIAAEELNWRSEIYRQFLELKKHDETLSYYRNEGLPAATELLIFGKLSFSEGEADYLEMMRSLEEAYLIRMDWWRSVRDYKQTLIELDFLRGNLNGDQDE